MLFRGFFFNPLGFDACLHLGQDEILVTLTLVLTTLGVVVMILTLEVVFTPSVNLHRGQTLGPDHQRTFIRTMTFSVVQVTEAALDPFLTLGMVPEDMNIRLENKLNSCYLLSAETGIDLA